MCTSRHHSHVITLALIGWAVAFATTRAAADERPLVSTSISPSALPAIGRVDPRFQSYNVEAVEVTGGNFWAPYPKPGEAPPTVVAGPHGADFSTGAYRKREPIDLTNPRLVMLAKALGPTYVRVSGSWANNIYFQDDDNPAMAPPAGYQGVLTRAQWASLVTFSKAVDAKILTSFATSQGARTADGAWDPTSARRLFAYTRKLGSRIDAVELSNEPNARRPQYGAQNFARDHVLLSALLKDVSPQTKLVGPGSTGEAGFKLFPNPPEELSTAALLGGMPRPKFDVFSHHFYGAVSQRCKSLGERNGQKLTVTTSPTEALTEAWLSRADQAQTLYSGMRDRFAPGAPIWITEIAQTACGGDRWSSTFLDTFRYVDQLGRLAKNQASVVFHNTLAASDYALIDDVTWQPRPNYWAALLWRRLMGTVVLDAGANRSDLHVYAHCLRDKPGGVAIVAVNLSRTSASQLRLPLAADRFTLSADTLESGTVALNGRPLALTPRDALPAMPGEHVAAGNLVLAPGTITFLSLPSARNPVCR